LIISTGTNPISLGLFGVEGFETLRFLILREFLPYPRSHGARRLTPDRLSICRTVSSSQPYRSASR
jgi:hypothetical protein